MPERIWVDGQRWFRIPEDLELPTGDLRLVDLIAGRERHVDAAAVAALEIDADAGARAVLEALPEDPRPAIAETFRGVFSFFGGLAGGGKAAPREVGGRLGAPHTAPPELTTLTAGMVKALSIASRGSPEDRARLRAQAEGAKAELADPTSPAGETVARALDALPDALIAGARRGS